MSAKTRNNKVNMRKKFESLRSLWKNVPLLRMSRHLPFFSGLLGFGLVLFDVGFDQMPKLENLLEQALMLLLTFELIFLVLRYVFNTPLFSLKVWLFDAFMALGLLISVASIGRWIRSDFFSSDLWFIFLFVLIFVRELASERFELKTKILNPAQLFILSFLVIIFIGAYVLTFPNSTVNGICFVDALFTSTSAVCVTGLSVVDTGTCFTTFGQIVIMVLIQLGGLGIMTFTSYFSFFFSGESSYENQFIIQEMTNSGRVSDVFRTLKRVLLLTFSIELIGAISIFISLESKVLPGITDQIYFSLFHAVSSFCNAGFSTLSNSLYDIHYRFNYPLQLSVAFLIIFGGIGFPILSNFLHYLKYHFRRILTGEKGGYQAWLINLNTRLVLSTTIILLVVGTVFFYWFEYDNTLAEHGAFGKWVTAFFGAVTPRTAGFNSVNNVNLHMSTFFLTCFLMWVGASPASTGGGIKTSAFAIAILNAIGLARGKDRIELYGRQLSDSSIRRAYAQMFMSLMAIAAGTALVMYSDPKLSMHSVVFECISAFSTVGLSLGITPLLTDSSKLIVTILMFFGRVSMLTVIAAFFKQVRFHKYRYPTEDITIN
jgi:trk system potassium uptake protein